jgi:RND family efflux transporter MFP subunit
MAPSMQHVRTEGVMRATAARVLLSFIVAGLVSACEGELPPVPKQVRPIRSFTITEVAEGQVRRFSGLIEAVDSSALSFEVGGNVERVLVNRGDAVRQGQELAVLDPEPYRLNVRAAEAELQRAHAFLAQARADYDRNKRLLEQRAVARVQFEVSQRDFQSAESQVDYAIARLTLVQRDLRNTTLRAPFDGTISERLVDPFVQVQAGQTVFRIDAEGGLQASIGVPETTIGQIEHGMPAAVTLPQSGTPIQARISEVGSAAGTGNVFPVKAALIAPPPMVRPGMTAEVTLVLGGSAVESSYFIPLSAIAPSDRAGEGFVFVYDPATSTVRRTLVRSAGPLASNMVAVSGVNVGDVLAAAGVNFLVDGQRVRLMDSSSAAPASG